jgi:hypothetical protein
MILNMGEKTTQQVRVACKSLSPDQEEAPETTELLGTLINQNPNQLDIFNHLMVIHYDSPETQNRRRELLVPVYRPVARVETKELLSIRVVFLVFKVTDTTIEEYYENLQDYIEQ